jgi:hypothetical protein
MASRSYFHLVEKQCAVQLKLFHLVLNSCHFDIPANGQCDYQKQSVDSFLIEFQYSLISSVPTPYFQTLRISSQSLFSKLQMVLGMTCAPIPACVIPPLRP